MVQIYLLGVFISAVVWFALIKVRQKGFYIPLPALEGNEGNLIDPLDYDGVDYRGLMIGWLIVAIAWPLAWSFLILFFITAWLVGLVVFLWQKTLGNEAVAKKILGGRL